jgi:predicted nucleic acid-binding protein
MSDRFFLDTNVLVYSFDKREPQKQGKARELIRTALEGSGIISWQVVQEFANVALHKFEKPMGRNELQEYLDKVLLRLCTLWPEDSLYHEALEASLQTGYRWYDSLVLVSALRGNAEILYSEDLQHGRIFRGMRICNPFV